MEFTLLHCILIMLLFSFFASTLYSVLCFCFTFLICFSCVFVFRLHDNNKAYNVVDYVECVCEC